MNLAEIRQQYPEYDDLTDDQIVTGLHQKHYSDMAFDEFAQRIGYQDTPNLTWDRAGGVIKEGVKDVARSTLMSGVGAVKVGESIREGLDEGGFFEGREVPKPGEFGGGPKMTWVPEEASDIPAGRVSIDPEKVEAIAKTPALERDPEYDKSSGYIEDFLRAGPQIGSQIVATLMGGPMAGMGLMAAQITGGTYENLVNQGVDSNRAFFAGAVNAIMQAPLEQIGISKIMKVWRPRKAIIQKLKDIGAAAGTEWLTEFLQSFPDMLMNVWAKDPEMKDLRKLNTWLTAVKEGAYEGTLTAPWALLGIPAGMRRAKPTEEITLSPEQEHLSTFSDLIQKGMPVEKLRGRANANEIENLKAMFPEKETELNGLLVEERVKDRTPIIPAEVPDPLTERKARVLSGIQGLIDQKRAENETAYWDQVEQDILTQRKKRKPVEVEPVIPTGPTQEEKPAPEAVAKEAWEKPPEVRAVYEGNEIIDRFFDEKKNMAYSLQKRGDKWGIFSHYRITEPRFKTRGKEETASERTGMTEDQAMKVWQDYKPTPKPEAKEPAKETIGHYWEVPWSDIESGKVNPIPKKVHISIIEEALEKGENVPPEVLAEYPDLTPAKVEPKGKSLTEEQEGILDRKAIAAVKSDEGNIYGGQNHEEAYQHLEDAGDTAGANVEIGWMVDGEYYTDNTKALEAVEKKAPAKAEVGGEKHLLYRGVGKKAGRHPLDLHGIFVTQDAEVAGKYGKVVEYESLKDKLHGKELLSLGTKDLERIAKENDLKDGEALTDYFKEQGYKAVRYPDFYSGDSQIVVLDESILEPIPAPPKKPEPREAEDLRQQYIEASRKDYKSNAARKRVTDPLRQKLLENKVPIPTTEEITGPAEKKEPIVKETAEEVDKAITSARRKVREAAGFTKEQWLSLTNAEFNKVALTTRNENAAKWGAPTEVEAERENLKTEQDKRDTEIREGKTKKKPSFSEETLKATMVQVKTIDMQGNEIAGGFPDTAYNALNEIRAKRDILREMAEVCL